MAIKGLSRFDVTEYVSDKDPCKKIEQVPIDPEKPEVGFNIVETIEEGATKFKLTGLDARTMTRIYDGATQVVQSAVDEAAIRTFQNKTNYEAVQIGLKGWENFADGEGKPIPFKTQKLNIGGKSYEVVSDQSMDAMGIQLIAELGSKIKELSEVSPDEEKKSDPASSPQD